MIAEKTADAIKGRKLAPFEPPTRIAGARHPPQYQPHSQPQPLPVATASYYNKQAPVPIQYPPPLVQWQRSQAEPIAGNVSIDSLVANTSPEQQLQRQFILNRYGPSQVADHVVKRISPVR